MSYKSLITHLKSLLDTIDRYDTDVTAGKAMIKTVWTVGKEVYKYQSETGKPIKDIALDAGAPRGSFEKYVRFYKQYSNGYKDEIEGHPLNWSHYAVLLYIGDKKAREFYLKNSALNDWSSHELRRRIRNNFYENSLSAGSLGPRDAGALKQINQNLYTYSATVVQVIDADTFQLDIDVGFCTTMKHKVRLRGINAPEKGTKKGEEAKKFVENELGLWGPGVLGTGALETGAPGTGGGSKNVYSPSSILYPPNQLETKSGSPGPLGPWGTGTPTVIIKSYKSEKFGRYLVDLWYLKGETDKERILKEGKFLNQVLLDNGLAYKVE